MAIKHPEHHQNPSSLLDSLYCEEEEEEIWDEDEEVDNVPFSFLEQDLFWEDEELISLFTKEQQFHPQNLDILVTDSCLSLARSEAVDWILKVNSHYGFSPLTAILAVNYLDRFLSSLKFQRENNNNKPWMIQLVAVSCISLAAKVEETQVPLLLDLQVEDTKYVFEAKTIQRMEVLVLSTLEWKMQAVTPISFLDHITRRLGLKTHIHWEFLRRCESLILFLVSDSRIVSYPPSVIATATMMHIIDQLEPINPIDYQNQLLGVLKISKERVDDCYKLITLISKNNPVRRKQEEIMVMASNSNGVNDGSVFSFEGSSDCWVVTEPLIKKRRVLEPSLSRVFMDIVGSPH